jgi:hypothetical protein
VQDVRKEGFGHSSRHKSSAAFVSERDHCWNLDPGLGFDFREDWRMALPELRKQVLNEATPRGSSAVSPIASLLTFAFYPLLVSIMVPLFPKPSPHQPL